MSTSAPELERLFNSGSSSSSNPSVLKNSEQENQDTAAIEHWFHDNRAAAIVDIAINSNRPVAIVDTTIVDDTVIDHLQRYNISNIYPYEPDKNQQTLAAIAAKLQEANFQVFDFNEFEPSTSTIPHIFVHNDHRENLKVYIKGDTHFNTYENNDGSPYIATRYQDYRILNKLQNAEVMYRNPNLYTPDKNYPYYWYYQLLIRLEDAVRDAALTQEQADDISQEIKIQISLECRYLQKLPPSIEDKKDKGKGKENAKTSQFCQQRRWQQDAVDLTNQATLCAQKNIINKINEAFSENEKARNEAHHDAKTYRNEIVTSACKVFVGLCIMILALIALSALVGLALIAVGASTVPPLAALATLSVLALIVFAATVGSILGVKAAEGLTNLFLDQRNKQQNNKAKSYQKPVTTAATRFFKVPAKNPKNSKNPENTKSPGPIHPITFPRTRLPLALGNSL